MEYSLIDDLIKNYPILNVNKNEIINAVETIIDTYKKGNKVLTCGNGGSSADSGHIVGELLKGFMKIRPISNEISKKLISIDSDIGSKLSMNLQMSLPAIDLTAQSPIISAVSNDIGQDYIYAQQVLGYGKENDVLIGLSTSGNSQNVVYAFVAAKALGVKTIALTGKNKSKLSDIADITINVSSVITPVVQELHLPIYHTICSCIESAFFEK